MRVIPRAGRNLLWPALLFSQAALASPPILSYATYLPGSSARTIAVDSSGNAYVGGNGAIVKLNSSGSQILISIPLPNGAVSGLALDASENLIAVVNAVQATGPASICCSVMKFDPTGKLISTFSPAMNPPICLALDPAGNIYLAGTIVTNKGNLTGAPISNSILTKINSAGATLYSFTFGGSQDDTPYAITVDSSGNAYIAGGTLSPDFPVTPGAAQTKYAGGVSAPGYGPYGDAFLAKIDPTGTKILYATYWGGSSSDLAYAVAVDPQGNAYIAGATSSADFPVTPGAFQTRYAGPPADPTAPDPAGDAFIAKFSPTGAALWSTYWGGASADAAYALTLDGASNVYFAGTTESFSDFPRAGPGVPTCRQTGGPFAAALDPTGSKLIHSTGMSGLGYDNAYAMALDATGAVYLAGATSSQVFFATPGAAQTTYTAGSSDAFAARIDVTQSGIYAACVLNGASFGAGNTSFFPTGAVAPGEIVSIFGSGLGPAAPAGLQLTKEGTVATSVAGVGVAFGGVAAPLIYVSNSQINAIVPYELPGNIAQMTVTYNGQSYGPVNMPITAAVPAIFTATGTGHGQVAALNQDGTLNSIANPAARGSVITFYVCGPGDLMTDLGDGVVFGTSNLPIPWLPVNVTIRGVGATVQYAGAAPDYVSGLLQVNVVVPTSIDFGNLVPLTLTVGPFASQLDVTIALK